MRKIQGFLFFLFTLILIYLLWRWFEVLPEYLGLPPYLKINLRLIQILFIFLFLLFLFLKINKETKIYFILSCLSLFTALSIAFIYKDSNYGIGADWGDMGFLTSYLTKLDAFGYNTDVFYKDLSSFYPPLYYYTLVLISKITGEEPYQMLKIGMIFSPPVIIFISFQLWRKFVVIEIAAILAFSILIFQDWYKMGAWISLIIFIPWYLYYIENNFLNQDTNKRLSIWHFIKGGILGAFIIQLQYYWLFTAVISSSILLFYLILKRDKIEVWLSIKNKLIILSLSLIFSLPYWGPYLHSLITIGSEPTQNRWYEDWMGNIYLPFSDPGLLSLFSLFGLAYLAIIAKRDKIALLLLLLTVSAYLWTCFGFLTVLLKIPVLHFKTHYLIKYLLALNALYSLGSLLFSNIEHTYIKNFRVGTYAIGIIFLIFFSQSFQNLEPSFKDQQYLKVEREIFTELSDNAYKNKVAITSHACNQILFYYPTFIFQSWVHYAHPSALYNKRNTFLTKLSEIKDPDLFAISLMNNRFNKVDYLYFDGEENKLTITTDCFPYPVTQKNITYPDSILSEKLFNKKERENFRLYIVNHEKNFLSEKTKMLKDFSLSDLVTIYGLVVLFPEETNLDILSRYKANEIFESIKQKIQINKGKTHKIPDLIRLSETLKSTTRWGDEYKHIDHKSISVMMKFLEEQNYMGNSYIYNVKNLSHTIGKTYNDQNANSTLVLSNKNPDIKEGVLFFGPYINLDSGNYKVIFHIKSMIGYSPKSNIGLADVFCQPYQLAQKEITYDSILSDSLFKKLEIDFHLKEPTQKIEFRIFSTGNAEIIFDYLEVKDF